MSDGDERRGRLQLRLRSKVTLLLLALSLAPLLVAGFVNLNRAAEDAKESVRRRHAQTVELTAQALAQVFARADSDLSALILRFPRESLNLPALRARVRERRQLPTSTPKAWHELDYLRTVNSDYEAVFLALPEGPVFFMRPWSPIHEPVDLARLPGFGSSTPEPLVGVLEPFTGPNRPRTFRLAPITRRDGTLLAWLGVVISPAAFQPILRRARDAEDDSRATLLVVDGNNRIATHSDPRRIGDPAPAFLEALSGQTVVELELGGVDHLAARSPVPRTRWSVYLKTRTVDAYRDVSVLVWILVAVILLTFVFVLLLADDLANRLLRPIQALEHGARMVGGGALDYRIELAQHASDELGNLATVFNEMGVNLLESRKELKTYSRSLETANKELDAMVYGITHELKKSLRGIDAFATFLEEDYADLIDDDGVKLIRGIADKVQRIETLASDLVGLVDQERERGEATAFDMGALLSEVADKVQSTVPGRIRIAPDLPEVKADRAQIALLFQELFENGLRFNHSESPEVTVTCADDMLDWLFEVTDNGIGIAPEYHDRIFEMFTRLNQPDQYPGSGTGLSLARRVAHEHRGDLVVEAVAGAGTRFVLRLPKEPMLLTSPGVRLGPDRSPI